MPLIIDTFNVLHTTGVLPPELASYCDVDGLVQLLMRSRYRNERIELVCDGSPDRPAAKGAVGAGVISPGEAAGESPQRESAERPSNVNIRYSGPGREADDVIAHLLRHSTAPRSLVVVSSDGAVLRTSRKRKCRTLSSQQFLQHLTTDHAATGTGLPAPIAKPPGGLSDDQVEAWLEVFDVDGEEAMNVQEEAGGDDSETIPHDEQAKRPPQNTESVLPRDILEEAERLLRDE